MQPSVHTSTCSQQPQTDLILTAFFQPASWVIPPCPLPPSLPPSPLSPSRQSALLPARSSPCARPLPRCRGSGGTSSSTVHPTRTRAQLWWGRRTRSRCGGVEVWKCGGVGVAGWGDSGGGADGRDPGGEVWMCGEIWRADRRDASAHPARCIPPWARTERLCPPGPNPDRSKPYTPTPPPRCC